MNPLRRKFADTLFDIGIQGLNTMKSSNPCARSTKDTNRKALLKEDVDRISQEVRISEASKLLKDSVLLKNSAENIREKHKKEIKEIAKNIIKRIEKNGNKLHLPKECRRYLINL